MAFHNGVTRFKSGDPGVIYGDDGRPSIGPSSSSVPTYTTGWRRFFGGPGSLDRRYEWRHGTHTTRYDDEVDDVDGVVVERRGRRGMLVEDRLVYDERPRYWYIFFLVGILLIVLGVLNLLFCLDKHWFSRLYAGLLLIILAVIGLLHKGQYRTRFGKVMSVVYIIVGVITAILVFLCLALVVFTFTHQTIDITQYGTGDFIDITKQRININGESVLRNVSSWETHIWMCYSFDAVTILLLLLAFLVLASVVRVIDNYYNNNYTYIRQVEPFCEPFLFNPYGQIMLGQTMIFFGFVISYAVYGNFRISWQTYMPLVWTGIVPIIAGFCSAIALKRCHKRQFAWAVVAIILQVIVIILSIVTLVLLTYGLYENIITINDNFTMTFTDYSQELLAASVIMFAIGDCIALLALFWALALVIMLLKRACGRNLEKERIIDHETREIETVTRYDEKPVPVEYVRHFEDTPVLRLDPPGRY